jgi:hypothetical protein
VVAAQVVLERGRLVDGERLVEQVGPVDPLHLAPVRVLADHQRVGRAVLDVGDAERLVIDHSPLRRVVGRRDALAEDAAVVAGAAAVDHGARAPRRRAQVDRQHGGRGRRVLRTVEGRTQIEKLVQRILLQVRQDEGAPRELPAGGVAAGRPPLDAARRELAQGVVVGVQRQADLPQVVETLRPCRRLADAVDRRQ